MELFKLIQQRRSIRKYTEERLTAEQLELIIRSLLWSPTSKNNRPWEFILVQDKGVLTQLSTAKASSASFIAQSALSVVIVADPAKSDVWVEDTAIAASFLQLQAEDLGLGSCWVQVRERQYSEEKSSSEYVKEVLVIPSHFEVASIIAIGHKVTSRAAYEEESLLREKIHFDRY